MAWMRRRGLDRAVRAAAARAIPVLGICGGFQMLGEQLGETTGLGLLPVATGYHTEKVVRPVTGETTGAWLLPSGLAVEGYEIHAGRTGTAAPLLTLGESGDGAVVGLVAGTYVHGLFDRADVRAALIGALRARKGLEPAVGAGAPSFDAIAEVIEAHLDLEGLV
jgi:adenosylcobyric acid synthase